MMSTTMGRWHALSDFWGAVRKPAGRVEPPPAQISAPVVKLDDRLRLSRLRAVPLFKTIADSELNELAALFATQRFGPGQVIMAEGDHGDRFYVLASGTVEVVKRHFGGRETPLAVLQDGAFFGEIALVKDVGRTATVRTRSDCLTLSLQRHQFDEMTARHEQLRTVLEKVAEARAHENVAHQIWGWGLAHLHLLEHVPGDGPPGNELAELSRSLESWANQQADEVNRLGELRRFLSPQLADLVDSGNRALLESHRREIAVVFVDLRGFTHFSETAEPEDAINVLREYHQAMGRQIHAFDGTVGFMAGDGLMVFFNDPVPCPDPIPRAVQMALGMRTEMEELSAKWSRRGFDLGWGAGLHFGYATLGVVGYEGRYDYTAIGSVVNEASRLCSAAKHGQILASQRVLAEAGEFAEGEHLGDFELKGFHRPVPTYNLRSLQSTRAGVA